MRKTILAIAILGVLTICFLSAGYSLVGAQDTAVLTMQGATWSLKVDASTATQLDSNNQPYVTVTKQGTEKELFLQLNSIKDASAGQVQFKIETNGLTIYKQLPLTEEENKTGVKRPIDVVNSFACYNRQGNKVMHIYASKLVDAKGNSIYVDSDLKDGLLTVYLDQKFLESATFPVTVDPTFGYTSIGGTDSWVDNNSTYSCWFTLAEDAEFTKFSIYGEGYGSHIAVAIYNSTSDKVWSATGTTTSYSWHNFTIPNLIFAAGQYALSFSTDGFGHKYDAGDANQAWIDTENLPAVIDGDSAKVAQKLSAFVTYTIYVAPTPTPEPPTATPAEVSTMTFVLSMPDWTLLLTVIALILAIFPRYHLANFVVGAFTIMLSLYLATTGTPLFAYWGTLFSVVIGIVCFLRGTDLL